MANTITNLYRAGYAAVNEVSRELVGMTRSVRKIVSETPVGAGVNQPISIPIVGQMAGEDIDASNIVPQGGNRDIAPVEIDMSKERKVSWHLTAEEQMALENPSGQNNSILQDSIQEAMRTLSNEIEIDLASEYFKSSRASGQTGASGPFTTPNNFTDFSQTSKLLNVNGCPVMRRKMVLNFDTWSQLSGTQSTLWRINEAGNDNVRGYGIPPVLLFGYEISLSDRFPKHAPGAVAGTFAVNHAGGYPIGTTEIAVDGPTGGDSINAGDVVSIADDASASKYVVTEAASDGFTTLKIGAPGLLGAIADDAVITITPAYTPNLAFHENAIVLACRPPASHSVQDVAMESVLVMDEHSQLVFELATYKQYRQTSMEVGICWGVGVPKPEHLVMLISS